MWTPAKANFCHLETSHGGGAGETQSVLHIPELVQVHDHEGENFSQ